MALICVHELLLKTTVLIHIQYISLFRYRQNTILIRYQFYIVNIADISLPLKIINIVNIATLTMGTLIFLFLIWIVRVTY